MGEHVQIPPRNGEGDRPKGGGGVLSASDAAFKVAKRERRSGNLPEVLIWRELRKRPGGFKFRRQHPLSELVLDFACLERDWLSRSMGEDMMSATGHSVMSSETPICARAGLPCCAFRRPMFSRILKAQLLR